jgi:phage FluMu protein Com
MIDIWGADMGMFDTVHLPCPRCKTVNSIQSKGGDSVLAEYHGLDNTPSDVLGGLLPAYKVISCSECNSKYRVRAAFETFIPDFQTEFAYWCIDNDYNLPSDVISHVRQFITMHRDFPAPTIERCKCELCFIECTWQFNTGALVITFDSAPNFIAKLTIGADVHWCAKPIKLRLSDEILNNLPFLDNSPLLSSEQL